MALIQINTVSNSLTLFSGEFCLALDLVFHSRMSLLGNICNLHFVLQCQLRLSNLKKIFRKADERFVPFSRKAADGSEHVDVLIKCCVIKALAGWHLTETASTCRERCGGQGYLSCNRFGTSIALSHAAITAEGDNSVLMQKVATEKLMLIDPAAQKDAAGKISGLEPDLNSGEYLHALLESRESRLFLELAGKMIKAGKKGRFDMWMYKEQDLVQAAARAYGERLISECFNNALEKADASIQPILSKLLHLYQITVIERNLGYFTTSGMLPIDTGANVGSVAADLCRDVAPQALALCDAFGISDEMLNAPIAEDWVKYNAVDNEGELTGVEF